MLTIYALPFVVSSYWFSFKSSSFCRWCRKKVKKLKKAKLKMERNQLMARLMLVFFPVFLISRFLAIFLCMVNTQASHKILAKIWQPVLYVYMHIRLSICLSASLTNKVTVDSRLCSQCFYLMTSTCCFIVEQNLLWTWNIGFLLDVFHPT